MMAALGDASHARVICLTAPGGYGKSMALAQWVARDERPVVWLSVRPAAADAAWLAQALLSGLAECGLVTEQVMLPGSVSAASWHQSILPLVERVVASAAEPFLVVVDNAQALSGSRWECLAESLASSLPAGAQLVLSTRQTMPGTLWRLRSREQVTVIGPDVLALDSDESRRVLRHLGLTPTDDEVRGLHETTRGWPVAVYLAAEAQRASGQPLASAQTGSELAEYLREEIIGEMSAGDLEFLSRVCILSSLDADACDVVASVTDSLERLRRLSSRAHLLWAEDEAAERFRMNPSLADALSETLHERDPAAWRAAHVAASGVEQRRRDFDGAVHHAKLGCDDARLAELVWSRTPHLLGSGQYAVLQRWLDGIDEDRLAQQCGLALSAAWVASHAGDLPRMSRLALAAAERAEHEDPGFVLDVALLAATIGADGPSHMEAAARAFVGGRPRDDPWQTLAYFLLGVALLLRDEPQQAVAALTEGRRLAVAHELPVMIAHCLAALADTAMARGEDHQALSLVRESRETAVRYRLDAITTTAPIFATSAAGYVLEGRFADARREAVRALRLTALMGTMAPWNAVQSRLVLAQVNLALGDPERARVLTDEAGDARGPATTSVLLDRLFAQTKERLASVSTGMVGASSLTTAEVRVLQYLPTHLSFPQIADELLVSRHTVKTQAMSTYRKLGAHTRTEAIARARGAGLLPPA
jgi:LuxR family maltose regulon positive regulatory protein